jgi:hypothetical protein
LLGHDEHEAEIVPDLPGFVETPVGNKITPDVCGRKSFTALAFVNNKVLLQPMVSPAGKAAEKLLVR